MFKSIHHHGEYSTQSAQKLKPNNGSEPLSCVPFCPNQYPSSACGGHSFFPNSIQYTAAEGHFQASIVPVHAAPLSGVLIEAVESVRHNSANTLFSSRGSQSRQVANRSSMHLLRLTSALHPSDHVQFHIPRLQVLLGAQMMLIM
jgi:hypothetical protein